MIGKRIGHSVWSFHEVESTTGAGDCIGWQLNLGRIYIFLRKPYRLIAAWGCSKSAALAGWANIQSPAWWHEQYRFRNPAQLSTAILIVLAFYMAAEMFSNAYIGILLKEPGFLKASSGFFLGLLWLLSFCELRSLMKLFQRMNDTHWDYIRALEHHQKAQQDVIMTTKAVVQKQDEIIGKLSGLLSPEQKEELGIE